MCACGGSGGGSALQQRAATHLREDVEIEKVHGAEHEQHYADFAAQHFEHSLQVRRLLRLAQSEGHVADVDQVKSDPEKVIDGIGQRFIAVKGIDQEEASILVQRPRHPDGQGDADDEVAERRSKRLVSYLLSPVLCSFSVL